MKITPQDINTQEFKRSLRGYDMDEVDAFLQQVAEELEVSVQESQRLKDEVKSLEGKLADYRRKDEVLEKTLITAQKMTEQMKDTSRREAEVAAAQAKAEAQKIVAEAHKQLVRFQTQLDELRRYRDAFVIQFKSFLDQQYRFLADFAKSGSGTPPAAASGETPRGAGSPGTSPSPKPAAAKAARAGETGAVEIEVVGDEEPVG